MTATRQNPEETQNDRIERKVDGICTWINGDEGAAVRLALLEQFNKTLNRSNKSRVQWAMIPVVAFLTAAATTATQVWWGN